MDIISILNHLLTHPLNRSNKTIAIVRYLKWQIGSRIVPGDIIFEWINDSKIVARTGETGVTGNIYCGLHEFPDMAYLLHVLRKEDLFVDIGANVGSYTILACAAIGARGYCFEPVPSTFSKLRANIKLNNLEETVVSFRLALGSDNSEVYFSTDQNCMNHVMAKDEKNEKQTTVKVTTLDTMLKEPPFLIKIDVEGYETPTLIGAESTLKNEELCSVIMELNGSGSRYGYDENQILEMMLDNNFKTYSYNPFERKLVSLKGKNSKEGNTLFIRNKERVLERLNKAPIFNVHNISL